MQACVRMVRKVAAFKGEWFGMTRKCLVRGIRGSVAVPVDY